MIGQARAEGLLPLPLAENRNHQYPQKTLFLSEPLAVRHERFLAAKVASNRPYGCPSWRFADSS